MEQVVHLSEDIMKLCRRGVSSGGLNDRFLLVQLPLLRERWKSILLGAMFQYVHAMATQLAHRMHRPMVQPLHDVGFDMLPVTFNACHVLWATYASDIHNVLVDPLFYS